MSLLTIWLKCGIRQNDVGICNRNYSIVPERPAPYNSYDADDTTATNQHLTRIPIRQLYHTKIDLGIFF